MAIINATLDDNGHLLFIKDTGEVVDAGNVRGIPGPQGEKGIGIKGDPGEPGKVGPAATPSAMTVVQNLNPQVSLSSPGNVGNVTIKTTGNPVLIIATGDANPMAAGAWCRLQIFRDTIALGNPVQAEESVSNVNVPYCVQAVDTPPAGTYTYTLKVTNIAQSFQFGEAAGPTIIAIELTGATGPQGPQGVGIKGFASGYVDAGQYVTLDNLKFTVTTGGSRGLSAATVSGTVASLVSGTFGYINGTGGSAATGIWNITTTPSGSFFGWSFPNAGDSCTCLVNDTTNQKFYRVTMMIGLSYLKNFISIERLI